jgi:ribosomal protein S20
MSLQDLQTRDPKAHTANIKSAMKDLIQHLRRDVQQVDEPKAQAMFETSAEVLEGLVTAFDHYEAAKEAAWTRR